MRDYINRFTRIKYPFVIPLKNGYSLRVERDGPRGDGFTNNPRYRSIYLRYPGAGYHHLFTGTPGEARAFLAGWGERSECNTGAA